MKKIVFLILLTALILAFPQPAHADYEDGERVSAAVVAPLLAWVEAQTGIKTPALPSVIASRSKLMSIVSKMGRIQGRARALYVGGVVVLDHNYFDPEDSTKLSLLVHELVHYTQSFKRASAWSCAQEKEIEAYSLQNKWLEEQGHSPFVSASWVRRVASCPAGTSTIALAQAQ